MAADTKVETRPDTVVENPLREAAPIVKLERVARPDPEPIPLEFTAEQRKMIREMFAPDTTDSEFAVLMEIARLKRLNPIIGQCHFVSRPANLEPDQRKPARWGKKWSVQVGIDGFRAMAEESPFYAGQSPKKFTYSEPVVGVGGTTSGGGKLISCTVEVYRTDKPDHPFVQTCFLEDYIQRKKDGFPTAMWEKQHMMLGKCTEAGGLRFAFPGRLGGLYTPDEMGQPEEIPPQQERKPEPPLTGPLSKGAQEQRISDADVVPEGSPTQATPVERFEHIRENVKLAVNEDELRVCWSDAKHLPLEMFEQIKQACFARRSELEAAREKGAGKPGEPHVERIPGSEG